MTAIRELAPGPELLDVTWDDGTSTSYLWLWLRDHSHDPETLHPVSAQRLLFTAGVPTDISAARAEVEGDELVVDWVGGGTSRLPVGFLARYRTPDPIPTRVTGIDRVLWDSTTISPTPSIPYEEVMASDEGTIAWLRLVATYGFALVTGTPASTEATEGLVRRVAYVRESIFGGFWWAHLGWIVCKKYEKTNTKAIPDFAKYPELMFLHRFELLPAVIVGFLVWLAAGWAEAAEAGTMLGSTVGMPLGWSSSHGSQNLTGTVAVTASVATSVAQIGVLLCLSSMPLWRNWINKQIE